MHPHHKPRKSRRAQILEKVLDCFEKGDWYQGEDYLVFGPRVLLLATLGKLPESLQAILKDEGEPEIEAEAEAEAILREILKNALENEGDMLASQRTSMDATAEPKPLFDIHKYSPQGKEALTKLLQGYERVGDQIKSLLHQAGVEQEDPHVDALDARYAREVMGKLEKMVSRVDRLDPFEAGELPSKSVREYFREVHHCYLYGFRVACAVMCRAILERALMDVIDPSGVLEKQLDEERWSTGKCRSYINALADKAKKTGTLADDRPEWLKRIKKAGNLAVHDLKEFRKEFPDDRFEEVLLNTRKILIDLYAAGKAG
jgi:vacuolar-type H+-ATPase subunit H